VIETVNRLATSVRANSTNQDNKPALERRGNLTVDTRAEQSSSNPIAEMVIKRELLFQLLLSFIGWWSLPGAAAINRSRRGLSFEKPGALN
jgi:hypothetical protein